MHVLSKNSCQGMALEASTGGGKGGGGKGVSLTRGASKVGGRGRGAGVPLAPLCNDLCWQESNHGP